MAVRRENLFGTEGAAFFLQQKGVALLMVIWILMLLTVIVTEFCYTMRSRVNITRNLKESTQAYYVAVAGVNRAIAAVLREHAAPAERDSEDAASAGEQSPKWRINVEMPPMAFADGEFQVHIQNASGRIELNRADKKLFQAVLKGFDIDEKQRNTIVDSILDWRDSNERHRANGAEDDYYQGLDPPYECKDDDFDSVDELLLVKGITPEIFYGGLDELVTVLPLPAKGLGGSNDELEDYNFNRVNINAASEEMWRRLPGMTPDLVEAVQEFRKEKPFTSKSQLFDVLGGEVYGKVEPYISMDSLGYYTIFSLGRVSDSGNRQGVEAGIVLDPEAERGYRMISWRDGLREHEGALLSGGRNTSE
ncbi:MAG TPA: helix-hairpin-helix domain-containing protein [Desulfosalsimonadaceae bacterium]|nr:helix-hairpin-helix domain-containing protein [Desulfosalsimonadaceae bacterium]